MTNPRLTATIVGALFWISNLAVLVGSVISGPIPNAPDSLTIMSPHKTQVVVGTLISHINDAAIIGYAVVLFPVVKRFSEALALGYVAFKVVEATMLVVGAAALLSLIALSQKYLAAGATTASYFQTLAELLVIPIILWEVGFATWLIVRGFNPPAVAAAATTTPSG